jgi:hypothetical protein
MKNLVDGGRVYLPLTEQIFEGVLAMLTQYPSLFIFIEQAILFLMLLLEIRSRRNRPKSSWEISKQHSKSSKK